MDQDQKPRERSFISELVPDWRPSRKQVLWAIRIVFVLVVLLGILTIIGLPFGITLWEWVKLLIVPAVIAAGGFWFNAQQREREQYIAQQRAQDEALQAYLDHMSTLMLDNDLRSCEENISEEALTARSVARARTLAVLPMLDGHRKYSVVLFLGESRLIHKESHIVWLVGADLSNLEVRSRANLRWNLSGTVLHGTDLSDADLHNVFLQESALSNTDLSGADLREADLSGADLSNADLSGANLNRAKVTKEQLEQAESLEGATMPNGQKYEDWLKSKGGGEE